MGAVCSRCTGAEDPVRAALAAAKKSESLHLERSGLYGELDERAFTCGKHVTEIFCHENALTRLPEQRELIEGWADARLISLNDNDLEGLPLCVYAWRALEELNVSRNARFVALPEAISEWRALRRLYLDELPLLKTLPYGISGCTNLLVLHVNGSGLEELPDEIGDLENLKQVSLNNNRLTSLPRTIANWKRVETLYLNSNRLMALPEELGALDTLRKLFVIDNLLKGLPPTLGQLAHLEELYVSKNPLLHTVPPELARCAALQKLYLDGCGLKALPLEILTPPAAEKTPEEEKGAPARPSLSASAVHAKDAARGMVSRAGGTMAKAVVQVSGHSAEKKGGFRPGPARDEEAEGASRRHSATNAVSGAIRRLSTGSWDVASKLLGASGAAGGPSALSLEIVNLSDNRVAALDVDWSRLPNLRFLLLRNNHLRKLRLDSLRDAPKLESCELEGNPILDHGPEADAYHSIKAMLKERGGGTEAVLAQVEAVPVGREVAGAHATHAATFNPLSG